MNETSPVVRYAPSPTGWLHLGNARPALLNWLFALNTGGRYILRLDDTDLDRSSDAFAAGIDADLAWLGIRPALRVRFLEGGSVTLPTWNHDRERVFTLLSHRELPPARLLK